MDGNIDLKVVGIDHDSLRQQLERCWRERRTTQLSLESLDRFSKLQLTLTAVHVRRRPSRRADAYVAVVHDNVTDKWLRLTIPDNPSADIIAHGSFSELSQP